MFVNRQVCAACALKQVKTTWACSCGRAGPIPRGLNRIARAGIGTNSLTLKTSGGTYDEAPVSADPAAVGPASDRLVVGAGAVAGGVVRSATALPQSAGVCAARRSV